MCITSGNAETSDTTIATWRRTIDGRVITCLLYQANVQNRALGPNCLFFPIPMRPTIANLERVSVIDTANFPNLLADMAEAGKNEGRGLLAFSKSLEAPRTGMMVAETLNTHVVIGDLRHTERVLRNHVPAERRPEIAPEFLARVIELRPDASGVFVCFDQPYMFRPEPAFIIFEQDLCPDLLVFPALDGHGAPPDINTNVQVDHTLVFEVGGHGTPGNQEYGHPVSYRERHQIPPVVQSLLPERVLARTINDWLPNGDFAMREGSHLHRTGYYLDKFRRLPLYPA